MKKIALSAFALVTLLAGSALAQVGTGQAINARTATSYTLSCNPPDNGKLVTFNNPAATAVTLPQAGTQCFAGGAGTASWQVDLKNIGTGTVTITPTTSTIDGATSVLLAPGQSLHLNSNGTNYFSRNPSLGSLVQAGSTIPVSTLFLNPPAGGHLTPQVWFGLIDTNGTLRFIPGY